VHSKMFKRLLTQRLLELVWENLEIRDSELERVHLLFISMKTLNLLRLSEMFPELKLLMLPV